MELFRASRRFFGLDGFGHTYFGFAIEYLALQVADAYHVIVHQSDGAYSGACQVKGDGEIPVRLHRL